MVLTAPRGELAERLADTDGGASLMATAPRGPGALTLDHLHEVMSELSHRRPVFHSEADFQHAFAQLLERQYPNLNVRLEIPYRSIGAVEPDSRIVVDLYCSDRDEGGATAIEFKYKKRSWSGTVYEENFQLLPDAANDLGRLYFVHDISRLEQWAELNGGTAFAILLTNDHLYWEPPRSRKPTNDAAFRIHEGVELAGELRWTNYEYPANTRNLRGRFPMRWKQYSNLSEYGDGQREGSQLRYVVAAIEG